MLKLMGEKIFTILCSKIFFKHVEDYFSFQTYVMGAKKNHLGKMCFVIHTIYRPAHKILVLIPYTKVALINSHADISSKARGVNFGLNFHLLSNFVYHMTSCLVDIMPCNKID